MQLCVISAGWLGQGAALCSLRVYENFGASAPGLLHMGVRVAPIADIQRTCGHLDQGLFALALGP